jgi:uncharacterized protein YlxW (UPF0749 family)
VTVPTGPGSQQRGTSDVLMALIRDPLDPGYAAAAARRSPNSAANDRAQQILAAAGAFVIGIVLVVAYSHEHRGAPRRAALHGELVAQVQAAEKVNDDLDARAQTLAKDVREARDAANPAGPDAAAALTVLEVSAGALAAIGPGLSVSLADSTTPRADPTAGGRSGVPGSYPTGLIGDRELRSVVNTLWAGGAEAIAINGVRLTVTSAIRFAGEVVLVDFRPITSPYRVEAVGDPEALAVTFADSAVASALHTLDAVGQLTFNFRSERKLDLPAAAVGTPRYAQRLVADAPAPPAPAPTGRPS